MNVYLLDPKTLKPDIPNQQRASFVDLADFVQKDKHRKHRLVDSAKGADLVIVPTISETYGPFFRDFKKSDFYKTFQPKVYVYCPDDNAYPSIPGIYPSLTQEWVRRKWAAGGHYISAHYRKHGFELTENPADRDLLYSFVGSSRNHALRAEIVRLQHPAGLISDSNSNREEIAWHLRKEDEVREIFLRYKEIMQRTKFALCPRGVSPSSVRLFEAMEAGCAPVIIADDLVLPQGPDWNSFSVMVPEKDISHIPDTLERLEPKIPEMSRAARQSWEDYFSPESTFNSLVDWIAALNKSMPPEQRNRLEFMVAAGEWCRPRNIRCRVRRLIKGH